jgi:PEP-CTERM motif
MLTGEDQYSTPFSRKGMTMKRNFVQQVLWLAALIGALCLLPTSVFATSNPGAAGNGGGGDPTGIGTATCSTGGSLSGGTGALVLDENGNNPATYDGLTAVTACNISTVGSGPVEIFDPPKYDGGALSDVLFFAPNSSGGTTAYLFSVGEDGFTGSASQLAILGVTSGTESITEFNFNGSNGYTIFDAGNASLNGGLGTCSFSEDAGGLNLSGCTNNGYIINSNTDELVPEPASMSLLGTGLLALGAGLRRKLLI